MQRGSKANADNDSLSGTRAEPGAVLCAICSTGITAAADLALTHAGATHVGCQRSDDDAGLP